MNRLIARSARWLAAVAFASVSLTTALTASAIPKAAEDEAAPVTFGADAPKPKISKVVKKAAPAKARPVSHDRRTHPTAKPRRK